MRTGGEPIAMAPAVEQTIHSLNAELPLYGVTTLKEKMQLGSVFERIAVTFAGSFGLLALLLAAVGIYGVVSYTTRQRTHEIGIRIALGRRQRRDPAQCIAAGHDSDACRFDDRADRHRSFSRASCVRCCIGVAATDLFTYATVATVLCVVAMFACYLPARRAAAVDPVKALRTE